MQIENSYFADLPYNYKLRAWRQRNNTVSIAHSLSCVAKALANWHPNSPLCRTVSPSRDIEISERGIEDFMNWLEQLRQMVLSKGFHLTSKDQEVQLVANYGDWLSEELMPYESIQVSLPSISNQEIFRLEPTLEMVAEVCTCFNAFNGYLGEDIFWSLSARNYWRKKRDVLSEKEVAKELTIIEKLALDIPGLLSFSRIGSHLIPNGIWWINYWNNSQIRAVGEDLVITAPWAKLEYVGEGGVILVTTNEPTDIRNPEHRAKIAQIVKHIHLQEFYGGYN
jgi:hypothetical protein